jgi:hypothetical protein
MAGLLSARFVLSDAAMLFATEDEADSVIVARVRGDGLPTDRFTGMIVDRQDREGGYWKADQEEQNAGKAALFTARRAARDAPPQPPREANAEALRNVPAPQRFSSRQRKPRRRIPR